jgi:hypothetical protein
MKTAKVIVNVGYFNGNGEAEIWPAYLCKASSGEEFIGLLKPALTVNGTTYVKTICWIRRENIGLDNTHNIPTSIINRLAYNIDAVLSEETEIYNRLKAVVVAAETTILAYTTLSYSTIGAVPAAWTLKGITIQQTEVDALIDVAGVAEPVGNGVTNTGGIIIPTSNALPELTANFTGAVQAAFKNPFDYAKANPISAVVMVVGIAQLANFAGLIKFNPLKKVTKLLK